MNKRFLYVIFALLSFSTCVFSSKPDNTTGWVSFFKNMFVKISGERLPSFLFLQKSQEGCTDEKTRILENEILILKRISQKKNLKLLKAINAKLAKSRTNEQTTLINYIIQRIPSDKLFLDLLHDLVEDRFFEPYYVELTKFFTPTNKNIQYQTKSPRIWDVPDAQEVFPLDVAIKNNTEKAFVCLLAFGADPNKIYKGRTTLMVAAEFAHINPNYLSKILEFNNRQNIDNGLILNFFDEKHNTEPVLWILVRKAHKTNQPEKYVRLLEALRLVTKNKAQFDNVIKGKTLLDLGLVTQVKDGGYKINRTTSLNWEKL